MKSVYTHCTTETTKEYSTVKDCTETSHVVSGTQHNTTVDDDTAIHYVRHDSMRVSSGLALVND